MSFLDLAKKRQSCRKYSSREVSRESITRCLEASRLAPSACNSQPWHFIVVTDPDLKRKVAEAAFSGIYSMNAFAKEVPILVIAIREHSKYVARLGGSLRGVQYSLIDLGIVCDHFTLQAAEEGLGTCWLGWFNERAVKKILDISRGKKIDVILSVGYPENEDVRPKNRKDLAVMSDIR